MSVPEYGGMTMLQYCRYCVYLCVNNVPYCDAKKQIRSEASCKRPNKCKDFCFADVEPEYQDAFGETDGYKPKERKEKTDDGQMSIFDWGKMIDE